MENFKTINVENGSFSVDQALAEVETEIEVLQLLKSKIGVLKIVHGYGSSGVGGQIKKALPGLLKTLKRQGKIADFFGNETLARTGKIFKNYSKIYPSLLVDEDLKNLNPGITIVFF